MAQYEIDDAARQVLLLALAKLSFSRPGWDSDLADVADQLDGRPLYGLLRELGPDPTPANPVKPPKRSRRAAALRRPSVPEKS